MKAMSIQGVNNDTLRSFYVVMAMAVFCFFIAFIEWLYKGSADIGRFVIGPFTFSKIIFWAGALLNICFVFFKKKNIVDDPVSRWLSLSICLFFAPAFFPILTAILLVLLLVLVTDALIE